MGRVHRRRRQDDGEQLPLPLELPRAGRPATRALKAAGRTGSFLLRWVLRLGLPLLGAAAVLQALPYHATVQGVPFTVQGTLLHHTGLSADTTLGSWEFPAVDGLPFGVHVTPRDVDLLALTRAAGDGTAEYVQQLRADFIADLPHIARWLVGECLLGLLLGLAAAAAVDMSARYLRGLPRRRTELRRRALQLAAAGAVVLVVAGYGVLSYNPRWAQQSRLTGTLAAAQLFPDQLSQYYTQRSKALDVLGSIVGIQAALQASIGNGDQPSTALQVMFVSDMHLAANYGLVARYADNYGVDLIVNTGDESEFGTAAELTPAYLDALRALTARIPMLWLAGNHDSPQVAGVMSSIPGVTVLGTKTAVADGYRVTADAVDAYGLTIAGLPDPRVYGAAGTYGADDPAVTDPLERRAVDQALRAGDGDGAASSSPTAAPTSGSTTGRTVDVFATHEPVAAAELRRVLGDRVRETVSGHTHAQNDIGDLQDGSAIDLVEGSTGAGGLDNIYRGADPLPIEFSIESVGADCQFTRIVRFRIDTPPADDTAGTLQAYGDDVTAASVSFRPQDVAADRTCGTAQGIGTVRPW
jgi:predicted MPP superfamily phosphohydrolase